MTASPGSADLANGSWLQVPGVQPSPERPEPAVVGDPLGAERFSSGF